MSNPIADNIEYFIEQESNKHPAQNSYSAAVAAYHQRFLRAAQESQAGEETYTEEEQSLWQSFIRRVSTTVQRVEAEEEEEEEEASNELQEPLSEDERAFMQNVAFLKEDDNLPSMEEVVQEGARSAILAEMKPSYFENPFESDSSSFEESVPPWAIVPEDGSGPQAHDSKVDMDSSDSDSEGASA